MVALCVGRSIGRTHVHVQQRLLEQGGGFIRFTGDIRFHR